jgi:signal transduction histidine kinase
MQDGGIISIETSAFSPCPGEQSDLPQGRYVVLSVSDSGCGMDKLTQNRIFEPFFTTKPEGKGTGLGLWLVQGIVKRLGGQIRASSIPKRGSTFKIYFRVDDRDAFTLRPAS